ncbi:MAG: PIN domain-containing protein [Alphaproteobacteria bacterium]
MSWESFEGHSLYLDSNIIILAIESGNRWTELLRHLFSAIEYRRIRAVASDLSLAEVLAKPLALGAKDLIATYERLFAAKSSLITIPISRGVLRLSAELQGRLNLKLADAIHVATAVTAACDFFLTNDDRLGKKLTSPRWISLPEIFPGT